MRRFLAVGALLGVGVLAVRPRLSTLHERLMAQCEAMFERMPDTFPPKKMMRGIDQLCADAARILVLLEARLDDSDDGASPTTTSGVHQRYAASITADEVARVLAEQVATPAETAATT